jgi:hypothetical protein
MTAPTAAEQQALTVFVYRCIIDGSQKRTRRIHMPIRVHFAE